MSGQPDRVVASMAVVFTLLALTALPASVSATQPSFAATYEVQLSHHFALYDYSTEQVSLDVSGTLGPHSGSVAVSVTYPFTFSDFVGLTSADKHSFTPVSHSYTTFTVQIPSNETSFDFVVEGTITGLSSLFFRNIATIPPVFVSMSVPPYFPVMRVLIPSSSLVIRSVSPDNASQAVSIGGISYLEFSPTSVSSPSNPTGVSILYQSPLSDYYAFLVIVALASLVFIIPFGVRRSKRVLTRVWQILPSAARSLAGVALRRRGTKWLFSAFVLLCLSMIAISTVFGPPPQPRAYLAATPQEATKIGPYITDAGWSYLTASQASDGFSRTSNLGTFSAAIIADYPPPILSSSPSQSGLQYVPHVIVMRDNVSSSYLSQLENARAYSTIVLNNRADITGALVQLGGRQNALGLTVSPGEYTRATQAVGVLSLLVPFFALAFMASLFVDLGANGIQGILEALAYSILVYFMAEFAFIVSTAMLGTPVALHAAISHSETAEGLLGPFGGGTRLREVSGIVGFLFGIYYNSKGSLSYDRNVLAAIAAGVAFVVADPLNISSSFYELLLTVSSNVGFGISGSSYEILRGIIGQPLALFQSYLTSGYVASHGDALFFVSALPFILYSRVGKGTGTLLMLFAALGCGIGFVRVADMIPLEVIASAAPGMLLGAGLILAFWAVDRLESVVRTGSPFG